MSNNLSQIGWYEEALIMSQASVRKFEHLRESHKRIFSIGLARAFENLALILHELEWLLLPYRSNLDPEPSFQAQRNRNISARFWLDFQAPTTTWRALISGYHGF